MPAMSRLVAQQGMEVSGLVDRRRELLERGRGPGFRARGWRPSRPRRPRRPAAASPRPAAWSRTPATAARARRPAAPAPARPGLSATPVCRTPSTVPPTSDGSAAPGPRTRPPASSRPVAPQSPRAPPAHPRPAQRSSSRSSPAPTPIPPQLPTELVFNRRATISTSGSSGMEQVCRPREAGVGRVRERSHSPARRTLPTAAPPSLTQ